MIRRFSEAAVTFSGGGFNHYASVLVKEIIDMGLLADNVSRLKRVYTRRASVMHEALQSNFGDAIKYEMPLGGYYFWIRFLDGLDTELFLSIAERKGVSYRPGNFFSESRRFTSNLRLTYTLFEPGDLKEGVSRLASAYHQG